VKNKLNRLEKRLNLLNLKKEANLVAKMAIAAPYKEDEIDFEIKEIGITKGEDGILTLSPDNASTISRKLDEVSLILSQIVDQLTEHEHSLYDDYIDPHTGMGETDDGYKATVDPRLSSLLKDIEVAGDKLYNASMMANHLRDGTGG
jgi:hypothetical protein